MSSLRSMTGFGSAEAGGIKVEIRSLNHKHADINVRAPAIFTAYEVPVRMQIRDHFSRGKFDVTISIVDPGQVRVVLNKGMARSLYAAFSELKSELGLGGALTVDLFSAYRDLLVVQEQTVDEKALFDAVRGAIDMLGDMRKREGSVLLEDVQSRLMHVEDLHRMIELRAVDMAPAFREAITRKVAELMADLPVDEVRVAQEIAIAAQKMDITEELVRLKSHIGQFRSFLAVGGVIGRRLDFLLQEMHRETNTISAKAADLDIINAAVEMKTEMERLKEQVQNLE